MKSERLIETTNKQTFKETRRRNMQQSKREKEEKEEKEEKDSERKELGIKTQRKIEGRQQRSSFQEKH